MAFFVMDMCPQHMTFCDLTWHIQGCTKACGALKILRTSQTLGMVSGQTSGNFYWDSAGIT